jgi:hypothetical protein
MAGGAFTAEEMAGAGCFVQVDGGGLLTFRKGYFRAPVCLNELRFNDYPSSAAPAQSGDASRGSSYRAGAGPVLRRE